MDEDDDDDGDEDEDEDEDEETSDHLLLSVEDVKVITAHWPIGSFCQSKSLQYWPIRFGTWSAMAEQFSALDLCSDGWVVRMWVRTPDRDRGAYVLEQDALP